MIGFDELGKLLEKVAVRDVELVELERDLVGQQWRTTISLEDLLGNAHDFTFYVEETAAADDERSTVTIGCVIANEAHLWQDETLVGPLLKALNDANGDPGVKYRLVRIDDGSAEVVCEADLPDRMVTTDSLSLLLDRVVDAVEERVDLVDGAIG